MTLSDYYPVIITILAIVGAIAALRIFFTLWAPVERRVNGDRLSINKEFHIDELKNKTVNIHMKSNTILESVILLGYCSTHTEAPYQFKQLLVARLPDQRSAYIRIDEIEYIEQSGSA
jgi:hypothetical protein